jgi:hypothetical protein
LDLGLTDFHFNRGCLALFGLGFLSLFVFGVTLEALNDPKELSTIPFKPWDFLTYGLIALGIPLNGPAENA